MPVEVAATIAGLEAWLDRMRAATRDAVAEGASEINWLARANAPIGLPTPGRLKASIRVTGPYPLSRDAYAAKVGPTVVYGRIRELGGHIWPHGHPFLAFQWAQAPPTMRRLPDGRVLARHVYQRGRPYLKPATEVVRARFRGIAERHWAAATLEV